MTDRELAIDELGADTPDVVALDMRDAIDLASDQNQITWLTSAGKRVAAVVPVGDAEYTEGFHVR